MITTELLGRLCRQLDKYKAESVAGRHAPHYAKGAASFFTKLISLDKPEYSECCDFLRMVYREADTMDFMDAQEWLDNVFDIIVPTEDL